MGNESLLFDAAPSPDQLGNASGDGGGAPGFPGSTASPGSDGYEDVHGLAGSNVTAVTFEFADGSSVEATIQNGWYFAWWPGDSWPSTVQVTADSQTTTSPMSVADCLAQTTGCVFAGRNPKLPAAG
jgi:hypothetical protein